MFSFFVFLLLPALVAAAGCASSTSWTFDSTNHSNQTIGDRSFLVHIPANYNPQTEHAVVLSFHGYGASDAKQEKITGFSKAGNLIDGKGIIAVYPLAAFGPGKHKKPARAWAGAPYSPQDVDDIAFVAAVVDNLQQNLCVDSKRIYASGMSNGGGFVNLLACSEGIASTFAAFAPVSAALYSGTHPFDDCNPGRKIPIINFHGKADKTIPFDGRKSLTDTAYATAPIAEWRDAWIVRNGCDASAPSDVSNPHDGVVETTWQCGDNNATTIKAFDIEDGIHRWPSTAETTFDGTPDDILPFFDHYALP
ncbi:alpha/beta-hydrolase [Mycena vulgaris]|nr:alpha/beta-hydrolase [Mycena vulgaris]